jgi:hypothetical protein
MADQARLEGRRGVRISAAGIEAAITVIRIAYRFETIARGQLARSEALLPGSVRQSLTAVEETLCTAFDYSVRRFESVCAFEPGSPSEAPLQPAVDLKPLIDELAVVATLTSQYWSSDARGVLVTQLESYHRLVILLGDLDAELSDFAAF